MEFYTPKEAGALLGVSEDTIINRIKNGSISAYNVNPNGIKGRYRIDKNYFDKQLRELRTPKLAYKNLEW